MLRRLLGRLRSRSDGNDDGDDEGGYVRSMLDASVLVSHGQGDATAKRELDDLNEEASDLAEASREAHD